MAANELWLVVYDIADDGRRARMARWFSSRGVRVQESVFELVAPRVRVADWLAKARGDTRFDPTADSLRAYLVCEACAAHVTHHGLGPSPRAPRRPVVA